MRQIRVNEMGAIPDPQKPQAAAAEQQQPEKVEIQMTQPQQTNPNEDLSAGQAMGFEKNESEAQKVDIHQGKDGTLFKTVYDSQGRIVEKSAYTEIGASRHLYTYDEDGTRYEKHYANGKLVAEGFYKSEAKAEPETGAGAEAAAGAAAGAEVTWNVVGAGAGLGAALGALFTGAQATAEAAAAAAAISNYDPMMKFINDPANKDRFFDENGRFKSDELKKYLYDMSNASEGEEVNYRITLAEQRKFAAEASQEQLKADEKTEPKE